MTQSLCGEPISSRRGLLASLWFLATILTVISFLTAFIYVMSSRNDDDDDYYYNREGSQDGNYEEDPTIVVTSRALAFCAMWTGVLSLLMSLFGTVVLGWQSPTGHYYTCCSGSVHRTTPLGLGSFIGALLMLSNLTLICSVLFGEFEIRENRDDANEGGFDSSEKAWERRSTMAFSILCMVLTVLYAGFAALTFSFANSVIEEHENDEREEAMESTRSKANSHFSGYDGYIGERFDVGRQTNGPSGFSGPSTTLG